MIKTIVKRYPILFRFIILVVLPSCLVLMIAYGYFSKSLPVESGTVKISGIGASVEIVRDKNAVPHIFAKTDLDAFFSLGYVHAQDRMWQMDFNRRLGQGRLSEIVGYGALSSDKLMRTLGLYSAAKKAWSALDVATRDSIEAYTYGVNAWIAQKKVLPIEFIILGYQPEPWKVEDSLLQVKLMALDLGQNFSSEITFDLLVKELGLARAQELMPDYPQGEITVTEASGKVDAALQRDLLKLADEVQRPNGISGQSLGSNAWVVSGNHTTTGQPILAADPHLANQIPSIWYLAELQGATLHVTGATVPGVPFVIVGHNKSIAWGETSLTADVQDLYVERVNPRNEDQYEVDGQWVDMDVKHEWINIKSELPEFIDEPIPPLSWQVRRTVHGPLISDALGKSDYPLSLRWTALDDRDSSMMSLFRINYAEDWDTFKAAVKNYVAPALNYLYADTDGNIAYIAAGKIPVRKRGDGLLPVPGWDSSFGWDGYLSTDLMPQEFNPDTGIIVSANNKIHGSDYPYLISNNWSPPYRAKRISEVINTLVEKGEKIGMEDFAYLQGDTLSRQADKALDFIALLTPDNEKQRQALSLLTQWDGDVAESSEAAALYQVWLRNFNVRLIADDLRGDLLHVERGDNLQDFIHQLHPLFTDQIFTLTPSSSEGNRTAESTQTGLQIQEGWCDQKHTVVVETCSTLALIALDDAIAELKRHAGRHPKWGQIHKTYHPHSVFSQVQLLDTIFDREIASGGDSNTINVAGWSYSQDKGYRQVIGPSYRQVIDVGGWQQSGFINSTGQSGNIFSKHYDDNIKPHKQMKLLPMSFGKPEINGERRILILEPLN